jgi:hypothetical protein
VIDPQPELNPRKLDDEEHIEIEPGLTEHEASHSLYTGVSLYAAMTFFSLQCMCSDGCSAEAAFVQQCQYATLHLYGVLQSSDFVAQILLCRLHR